jgi:hypothetical protein
MGYAGVQSGWQENRLTTGYSVPAGALNAS